MTGWQPFAAGAVVLAAIVYLVWKLGFASRPKKKKRPGPDVPVDALTRKRGQRHDP